MADAAADVTPPAGTCMSLEAYMFQFAVDHASEVNLTPELITTHCSVNDVWILSNTNDGVHITMYVHMRGFLERSCILQVINVCVCVCVCVCECVCVCMHDG